MKQKFDVIGMTCSACSAHVEKAVSKLDGVNNVTVNLLQNSMQVDYDEEKINAATINEAVGKAGYGSSLPQNKSAGGSQNGTKSGLGKGMVHDDGEELGLGNVASLEAGNIKKRLIISFVFLVPLLYISMGHMIGMPLPGFLSGLENSITYAMAQFLLTLPIIYANRNFFIAGFKSLSNLAPTMDTLVAIGSGAAVIYGVYAVIRMGNGMATGDWELVESYHMDLYFESAAMILALITVGKYMEARSKGKTTDALSKLMNLRPKTAWVIRERAEVEIPIDQVVVGDVVIVKPGVSIPVDGMVIQGNSTVDESAITGESIPTEKNEGDKVASGTTNKSGYFKMRAERVGSDTTLAKIIELVEEANSTKAPIARMADKVSGVFVPVVLLIAGAATITWLVLGYPPEFAISIGISVLVISCPCALGLATPTAIMVGTGKGAENGILYKSAESLERAKSVTAVVLDKTGTITEGEPKVTDVLPYHNINPIRLLEVAYAMENQSEHPLADAITSYCDEHETKLEEVSHFSMIAGRGITAEQNGRLLYAGNLRMMEEKIIDFKEDPLFEKKSKELQNEGKTLMYFAESGKALGVIAVADTVKETSKQAVSAFERMGLVVTMMTGDNKETATAIGAQVGLKNIFAEVLPQDKEGMVRKLQDEGKTVAMIGDGINDAPALARADVGIAIGAGTDIAMDSADIVLMKSDLLDGVKALELSRAVVRNIKQNLFWAFFYNAIGIPLAAGAFYFALGWKLNPMFAAAAMSLSSFCVVSNALRLRFWKPTSIVQDEKKEDLKVKKVMKIQGMSCGHCQARVEKALAEIPGVADVNVNLESGEATVSAGADAGDQVLKSAVEAAGYDVISVVDAL